MQLAYKHGFSILSANFGTNYTFYITTKEGIAFADRQ